MAKLSQQLCGCCTRTVESWPETDQGQSISSMRVTEPFHLQHCTEGDLLMECTDTKAQCREPLSARGTLDAYSMEPDNFGNTSIPLVLKGTVGGWVGKGAWDGGW